MSEKNQLRKLSNSQSKSKSNSSKSNVVSKKSLKKVVDEHSDSELDSDEVSEYETIDSDDESDNDSDDSSSSSSSSESDDEDEIDVKSFIKQKFQEMFSKLTNKKEKKSISKKSKKSKKSKVEEESENESSDEEEDDEEEGNEKIFSFILNSEDEDYDSELEKEIEKEEKKQKKTKKAEEDNPEKTFLGKSFVDEPNPNIVAEPTIAPDLEEEDILDKYQELVSDKNYIMEKLEKKPNSDHYKKRLQDIKLEIKQLAEKGRKKNKLDFYKSTRSNKKKNELEYFEKHLSYSEQNLIIQEQKSINEIINIDKPYRLTVLQSDIPKSVKAIALQKLNALKQMEPGDPEYFKLKHWIDSFIKIPFNKYKSLPVSGINECHDFMEMSSKILDECTYGMNETKLQFMQLIGQWIVNPQAMGNAIALHGPAGVGKTSILKDGISKILGRDFVFIPLGGSTDGSYLEGNGYVYEGSSYGKIIQSIIQCGSMNPIFYFDELDKVSDSERGKEIIGILTHLTDTSQNSQFHDKYFSEIDFDVSKCLFVFSYNNESMVNPILKDRMYKIKVNGYSPKEKIVIGQQFLIPKIIKEINFRQNDVIVPDKVIHYIVENYTNNQYDTSPEEGVRNLKRCLETIYTKLNLFRLVKPGTKSFITEQIKLKVEFPYTVSTSDVDVFIKQNKPELSASQKMMYV